MSNEFIKMPLGFRNCPETFHNLMFKFLHHRRCYLFFYDDVIVVHEKLHDHIEEEAEILGIFACDGLI